MSAVSESIAQRVTLGMLVERYGFEVDPPFATNVTITSLSDAVDTVIPGSLFICTHEQEPDVLHAAQAGAYAALLPRASKGQIANADIPLLYGDFDDRVLGDLASGLAGGPSNAMAVFAVTGADEQAVDAGVSQLSEFLHMLGNPVAVITASGSHSVSPVVTSFRPTQAAISPACSSSTSWRSLACISTMRPMRSFLPFTGFHTASPFFSVPE